MIYLCVCDGKVIGFAGMYSALIGAGVVCPNLTSNSHFYCFRGFYWDDDSSIFADSFGLLMSEVGRHFYGRTIYNPVYLSEDAF